MNTERFKLTVCREGITITDPWSGTECTTTAPAGIIQKVIQGAEDFWRACDVAGFAELRASRNITPAQVIDNGRTFRRVAQPDLFA